LLLPPSLSGSSLMRFSVLFVALIAISAFGFSYAQDETAEAANETVSTNVTVKPLEPHPDISTTFIFPQSAERRFVSGVPIDILIGFYNGGDQPFNVTEVSASLMYPLDWRIYIQNYTKKAESVVVAPKTTATFAYKFLPDPFLEPREFGLTANVLYSNADASENFTSVGFNNTITLVESSEPVDLQSFFMYVGIIGIAGLIGFIVFQSLNGLSGKKPKRPKIETGTQKTNVLDADWLEGTAAARSPAQKRPKRI